MSKGFDIPSNKHLGNSHDYWEAPQKNSKQIIIQSMNWIKITDRMPDKDITVLAWCNGEVALACRYKDNMYNAETLSPINPQYWCEITPPTKD